VADELSTAVLIPYRGDNEWRERARSHVLAHYATAHPEWAVVEGACEGEWSKGAAVADALRQTAADLLVVADADCLVDPGALRFAAASAARVGWAVPHLKVHRLTRPATESLYQGGTAYALERPAYRGVKGGGVTAVRRDVYERAPIDPRFRGWGGEDLAWGWTLATLYGAPWRAATALTHLWHPSARVGDVGDRESRALLMRWRFAGHRPDELDTMLTEAREAMTCAAKP
jgi:hypothetical protein